MDELSFHSVGEERRYSIGDVNICRSDGEIDLFVRNRASFYGGYDYYCTASCMRDAVRKAKYYNKEVANNG